MRLVSFPHLPVYLVLRDTFPQLDAPWVGLTSCSARDRWPAFTPCVSASHGSRVLSNSLFAFLPRIVSGRCSQSVPADSCCIGNRWSPLIELTRCSVTRCAGRSHTQYPRNTHAFPSVVACMHMSAGVNRSRVDSFAALLRRFRLSAHFTQEELADQAGLSVLQFVAARAVLGTTAIPALSGAAWCFLHRWGSRRREAGHLFLV